MTPIFNGAFSRSVFADISFATDGILWEISKFPLLAERDIMEAIKIREDPKKSNF